MSLSFQNPALLPFLACAALPLLIHLLTRLKAKKYLFSSNMFLSRAVKTAVRVKRPNDWLALTLRTLFALFLAAAFCKPRLVSEGGFELEGAKRLVILLDASASMACPEEGGTRFAAARAEASDMLSGLRSGDSANIVLIKSSPEALFPRLGVNFSELRAGLRRLPVSSEAGDPDAAFRLALSLLEGEKGGKICVISDFQKTQWEKFSRGIIPPGTAVLAVKTGRAAPDNAAVTDVTAEPAGPLAGESVRIICQVSNYAATPAKRNVYLKSGEIRDSRQVIVPARGVSQVTFQVSYPEAGVFPVELNIDSDKFPADDVRFSFVTVRDSLELGIIAGDGGGAAAFRKALEALSWGPVRDLSLRSLDSCGHFDAVIVAGDADLSPENVRALSGKTDTLIIQPGALFRPETLRALAAGGVEKSAPLPLEKLKSPAGLKINNPGDRALALFSGDGLSGAAAGALTRAGSAMFKPEDVLISFTDGTPALARLEGGRSVYLWNIPLGPGESNFASRPFFVPLLGELILSGRSGPGSGPAEICPGGFVSIALPPGSGGDGVSLTGPGGRETPLKTDFPGGQTRMSAGPLSECGIYEWRGRGKLLGMAAVNFPPPESDLAAFEDGVPGLAGNTVKSGARAAAGFEPVELWPPVFFAALLAAALETLLIMRRKRESASQT
jgi:hypothetical protein